MKKIIGLTGSIATGKTTVANMFMSQGVYVIDSDVVAKEVSKNEAVLAKIAEVFGPESIDADGQMDRIYVGNVVFSDYEKRMALNDIIHPEVKKRIQELVENRCNNLVVVDVPLMFETDFHEMMDEVIVVYAPEEHQIYRLMGRNMYSYEEAQKRVESQMSIEDKKKLADHVLDNSGTKVDLNKHFKALYKQIMEEVESDEDCQ